MTEEIINDIDKLDGMIKIKGKCGYEFIGGCYELRRLKQENKELAEQLDEECLRVTELATENTKLEQENKELLKYETYYLDKYIELRDSLEEIRGKVNQSYQMADRHIILNIINEVLK